MNEAHQNQADTQNDEMEKFNTEVNRISEKLGMSLDGENTHLALAAVTGVMRAIATNEKLLNAEQRKAASLFILSTAVQMTIAAGVSDDEITNAMVRNEFFGEQPTDFDAATPQIILPN